MMAFATSVGLPLHARHAQRCPAFSAAHPGAPLIINSSPPVIQMGLPTLKSFIPSSTSWSPIGRMCHSRRPPGRGPHRRRKAILPSGSTTRR
ncbi:hypothetical protein BJX76DRAFT_320376 [Aspergillus varians]